MFTCLPDEAINEVLILDLRRIQRSNFYVRSTTVAELGGAV